MALDLEPMNLLSKKLAVGCYLNAHLQTLLGRPLDSHSQEEAMAVSQEVSRVFTEAMSVLKHANSCRVGSERMAPEILAGNTIGLITPTKEKRVSGQDVNPLKKGREEEITRREITPSPHEDGYQWKKYGQKNIQNKSFPRYYFKCNRHRRCEAKKKVQQQDQNSSLLPPMFEVTYVNDHTCHVLRATDDTASRRHAHAGGGAVVDTAAASGGGFSPHIIGGGAEEDEAIVSCLATVISGAMPPPPPPRSLWPPAAGASAGGGDPAADEDGTMMVMDYDTGFSWWDDAAASSFCGPVEEAGGHYQLATTNHHHSDVHMDVARFADTESPRHACGAWRRA